ncbi:hypothetical protein BU17DRAFT_40734 [Hysterangium stoloniferum]|nr:hypothetical protein BU17DRAFT_40734 [Hysterangium stoloniferum]
MAPKEPTRHQLSSRLQYQGKTPSFLLKLQNRVAGRVSPDGDEGEDDPQTVDGVDEFGRERRPAPTSTSRPPIPERPADHEGGSEDEDDKDERPVVVVLKEGKHLTAREAENEKRKAQGLAPLAPEPDMSDADAPTKTQASTTTAKSTESGGLSFSSSKRNKADKPSGLKRKAGHNDNSQDAKQNPKTKKPKKSQKGSLSFDQG